MKIQLELRLRELVDKAFEKAKSWQTLQKQIAEATGIKDFTVDRRKLKKLGTGKADSVTLTIRELKALQIFFTERQLVGLRENMIFSRQTTVLEGFANLHSVVILMATRYSEGANVEMSSRWDLRASQTLSATREIRELELEQQDVFHYGPRVSGRMLIDAIKSEKWYPVVFKAWPVISIASPFLNYASECLLCDMLGVPIPFDPCDDAERLPFRFYWETGNHMSRSAFELRGNPPGFDPGRDAGVTRGLVVRDQWYPANRDGKSTHLVVAQFKHGHLRVVLAGIYAPATLALAKELAAGHIPLLIDQNRDNVLVAMVECSIGVAPGNGNRGDSGIKRDSRELRAHEFTSAHVWNPATRDWVDS